MDIDHNANDNVLYWSSSLCQKCSFFTFATSPMSFSDASPDRSTILTNIPKQNLELTSFIYKVEKKKSAARLFKIPLKIGLLSTAIFFTLSPFCPKFY